MTASHCAECGGSLADKTSPKVRYCGKPCAARARRRANPRERVPNLHKCFHCARVWDRTERRRPQLCPECKSTLAWCGACKSALPQSMFRASDDRCRKCLVRKSGEYRRQHGRAPLPPERTRRTRLKTKYGITPEEVDRRMTDQDGKCFICARAVELVVDHDHDSGAFRGLLCRACNVGLGAFRDEIDLLMAAAAYLLQSSNVIEKVR